MASRLAESIKQELEIHIDQVYFWTDSRCVLGWIKSDGRKYKQFVAHRIGEIQERTQCEDWRWVPSAENPADEATRTETACNQTEINGASKMIISKQWFKGPDFLNYSQDQWPKEKNDLEYFTESEIKKEFLLCEVCLIMKETENVLPDLQRFSKWLRLIRTTAWCLRFIRNSKLSLKLAE